MPVEAQMQEIGTLPNGDKLYYADPKHFANPGLKVWNGTDYLNVNLIGSAVLVEAAARIRGVAARPDTDIDDYDYLTEIAEAIDPDSCY